MNIEDETTTLLKEIKEILQKQNEPKILYVKDVARILGINQNKANELWHRKDFPRYSYRTKENRTKGI